MKERQGKTLTIQKEFRKIGVGPYVLLYDSSLHKNIWMWNRRTTFSWSRKHEWEQMHPVRSPTPKDELDYYDISFV